MNSDHHVWNFQWRFCVHLPTPFVRWLTPLFRSKQCQDNLNLFLPIFLILWHSRVVRMLITFLTMISHITCSTVACVLVESVFTRPSVFTRIRRTPINILWNKQKKNISSCRELRMQSFYLTFLRKMSFLAQMFQKVTELEFFRKKKPKSL